MLVCPIPHHIAGKCCSENTHVEKFSSTKYKEDLSKYQDQRKWILVGWGVAKVFNRNPH
jgi:hypothetical protein